MERLLAEDTKVVQTPQRGQMFVAGIELVQRCHRGTSSSCRTHCRSGQHGISSPMSALWSWNQGRELGMALTTGDIGETVCESIK